MVQYRKVELEELSEVETLERMFFSDAWSLRSLRETWQTREAVIYGAFEGKMLVGYAILYCVLDEGELVRIAVSPSHRRRNVACSMLMSLLTHCREVHVERVFLEVRKSNISARAFYEKNGFTTDGNRKNFYEFPTEDAILMSLEVPVLPTGTS